MFNLQGSELIIILLLALVVLGPEKLPEAVRKAGQFLAEIKKMSTGFQQEFRAVIDEPLKEVKDTANLLRESVDLQQLQDGTRDEKPKSAEMAASAPADVTPTDEVPTFEAADDDEPVSAPTDPVTQPPPKPFSSAQQFSAAPTPVPPVPEPFPGSQHMSSAPRPDDLASVPGGETSVDEAATDEMLPGETAADETPAHEATTDETPADGAPNDEPDGETEPIE